MAELANILKIPKEKLSATEEYDFSYVFST